jgi:hypothetical protein
LGQVRRRGWRVVRIGGRGRRQDDVPAGGRGALRRPLDQVSDEGVYYLGIPLATPALPQKAACFFRRAGRP